MKKNNDMLKKIVSFIFSFFLFLQFPYTYTNIKATTIDNTILEDNDSETIEEELVLETTNIVKEEISINAIEELDEEKNSIQASQLDILNNEIIVYSYAELKEAITNTTNGKNVFYLGADIIQTNSGIAIPSSKQNIIIDGKNPNTGISYSYSEYKSATTTNTIYLNSATADQATIELKNMNILGQNYYGTVLINDAVRGATLIYDNVTYDGPQLIFNRYGTALIKDSNITIGKIGYFSPSQQVGEVYKVIFDGSIEINHYPSSNTAIFETATVTNGFTKVNEGANVIINSEGTYNSGTVIGYNFIMNKSSSFTFNQIVNSGVILTGSTGYIELEEGSILNLNRKYSAISTTSLISWSNVSGFFKSYNSVLNINVEGEQNAISLNLGKTTLSESKINILLRSNTNNYAFNSAYTTELINGSEINIHVLGNGTAASFGFNNVGLVTASTSKIKVISEGTIINKMVYANAGVILNNSTIDIVSNSTIITPGTNSQIFIGSNSLIYNKSLIKGLLTSNSGTVLNSTSSIEIDDSEIDININSSSYPVFLINGDLTTKNSNVKIEIKTASSTNGGFGISSSGNINFLNGSDIKIQVFNGSHLGLIYMTGTNKKLTIIKPELVLFDGQGSTSKLVYNINEVSFEIDTQQIGQRPDSREYILQEALYEFPLFFYSNFLIEDFIITGKIAGGSTGQTTVLSNTLYDDSEIYNFSFNAIYSKYIAIGTLELSFVNEPKEGDTLIKAITRKESFSIYTYYVNGERYDNSAFSNELGEVEISTLPLDINYPGFEFFSTSNHLYAFIIGEIQPLPIEPGELKFSFVPEKINFETSVIPSFETNILERTQDFQGIGITDTRIPEENNANWKLKASVLEELKSTKNDLSESKLTNAFVFINELGQKQIIPLSSDIDNDGTLIYQSINGQKEQIINWTNNKGLLIEVNPGNVFSNIEYNGVIEWTLEDTP